MGDKIMSTSTVSYKLDKNGIPFHHSIMSGREVKKRESYKLREDNKIVSEKLHGLIEKGSIGASAIGTGGYLASQVPVENGGTAYYIIFAVGFVAGLYVGKTIAQGQQKLLQDIFITIKDRAKEASSIGIGAVFSAIMGWASIVALDTTLMGSGSLTVAEASYKANYEKMNKDKIDEKIKTAKNSLLYVREQILELRKEKESLNFSNVRKKDLTQNMQKKIMRDN